MLHRRFGNSRYAGSERTYWPGKDIFQPYQSHLGSRANEDTEEGLDMLPVCFYSCLDEMLSMLLVGHDNLPGYIYCASL